MAWTKQAPKIPGFYYWRGGLLKGRQVAVVQVSAYKDEDRPLLAQEMRIGGYQNAPCDGPAKDWGSLVLWIVVRGLTFASKTTADTPK